MRGVLASLLSLAATLILGCSLPRGIGEGNDAGFDATTRDAGTDSFIADAGTDVGSDASPPDDTGLSDAGEDGAIEDAGTDAGTDGGPPPDAGCDHPWLGRVTLILDSTSNLRPGGEVVINYSGMTGSGTDWINIVPFCAPDSTVGYSTRVPLTGGFARIPIPATAVPGSYVMRGYFNDTFVIEHEAPPFTIAP